MFRLLALDVDGTLTDGGVFIDGAGHEFKRFHVRDGLGIAMFKGSGGTVVLISARQSDATLARAKELGMKVVMNGKGEKLPALQELCRELGVSQSETAYVGDDLNDCACIRWAGFGAAVADAVSAAKEAADWITQSGGGFGAVREVTDELLRRNAAELQNEMLPHA